MELVEQGFLEGGNSGVQFGRDTGSLCACHCGCVCKLSLIRNPILGVLTPYVGQPHLAIDTSNRKAQSAFLFGMFLC